MLGEETGLTDEAWQSWLETMGIAAETGVESLQALAEAQRELREENQAETDNYAEQLEEIGEMQESGDAAGIMSLFGMGGEYSAEMQEGLAEQYGDLAIALGEVADAYEAYNKAVEEHGENSDEAAKADEDLAKAMDDLGGALDDADLRASAKYFEDTADAIGDLEDGTIDASDAIETYRDEAEDLTDAWDAFQTIQKKGISSDTEDELETLASYLNTTKEALASNWDASGISNALNAAGSEAEAMFARIQEAALIQFVLQGRSDVDLSQARGELISTQGLAQATINELVGCGAFELKTLEGSAEGISFIYDDNGGVIGWRRMVLPTQTQVLVPSSGNPLKGRSGGGGGRSSGGGGGGGGGGGSSYKGKTEQEKMLDKMDSQMDIIDHRRTLMQLAQEYYDAQDLIQGVILYMEKEQDVIREQNATLEDYVAK